MDTIVTVLSSPNWEDRIAAYAAPKYTKSQKQEIFIQKMVQCNSLFVDYFKTELETKKDVALSKLVAAW